ncbi:unnamed protein product [Phytophthora fragariaefolia]|uniref:Unnamed protein product n=1 Tax=Phytophthora fragariaefolia TaxID=1490495 RepID=A0A9W6Y306_9STRA|nr:unnamed protein product [Phytophthora fragariaefolia]
MQMRYVLSNDAEMQNGRRPAALRSVENLSVHDVRSVHSVAFFQLWILDHCLELGWRRNSREGHVQLTTGEAGRRQVQSQVVHRLSLPFVDGHSERRLDRELLASQLAGKAGVITVAYEHDSWNQHVLSAALPGHDLGVDDIGLELHHPKSSTDTKSSSGFKFRMSMIGAPFLSVSLYR